MQFVFHVFVYVEVQLLNFDDCFRKKMHKLAVVVTWGNLHRAHLAFNIEIERFQQFALGRIDRNLSEIHRKRVIEMIVLLYQNRMGVLYWTVVTSR